MYDMVKRFIGRAKATTQIEYPLMVLQSFKEYEPLDESVGQFTAGVSSVRYVRNDNVYEFVMDSDNSILSAEQYPIEFA